MLASSSRNALKNVQGRLAHVAAESSAAQALIFSSSSEYRITHSGNSDKSYWWSESILQQQRQASTAHAVVAQNIFVGDHQDDDVRRSGLRHRPYSLPGDPRFRADERTPLARHNMDLARHANSPHISRVFRVCQRMKEEGVRPDLTTYTHLLQACIRDGLDLEARAIFEDMLAVGLNPTRQHFHLLLDVR